MSDPQPIPGPCAAQTPPHADPDPSGPVPGRLDRDGATAPPEPPSGPVPGRLDRDRPAAVPHDPGALSAPGPPGRRRPDCLRPGRPEAAGRG